MHEVTVMKGHNDQQLPKRGTQQQGRHYCSGDSAEDGCGSGGAGGKETCAAPPPGQKCTTIQ